MEHSFRKPYAGVNQEPIGKSATVSLTRQLFQCFPCFTFDRFLLLRTAPADHVGMEGKHRHLVDLESNKSKLSHVESPVLWVFVIPTALPRKLKITLFSPLFNLWIYSHFK